ncbi:MAG: hypothetical protein HRU15_20050 [Planctomycetes bacterium]|nr:hypothetical protein [Planctomycetota bacterium]
MSHLGFLHAINLNQKKFATVRQLIKETNIDEAAQQTATIIFEKPAKHIIRDNDINSLVKHIKENYPSAITELKNTLKTHRSDKHSANVLSQCHVINLCTRLYHLSGEKCYKKEIQTCIRHIANIAPKLPDDDLPSMFIWHAGDEQHDHHHFNYALYELYSVLPLIRELLSATDKLQLLKTILAMAEFSYRSTQDDVVYNHPLGYISGVCVTACAFPDFNDSAQWLEWSQNKILHDCIDYPTFTEDGYAREGFGYQEVNAKHLIRASRALKTSGVPCSPKIHELAKKSCTFFIDVLQNNGHYPLIGDCGPTRLYTTFMWHQASALFRSPALKFMNPVQQDDIALERLSWEVGLKGIQWWEKQKNIPLQKVQQIPRDLGKSGFQIYGFGSGKNAHYGMLCYALSHNHAHHDVGSINISAFNRALISDPGKTTYTQPFYLKECLATRHNLSCLIRRNPLGPRVDDLSYSKTIYVQHSKKYQASAMQHTLYENHTYKRSLIGIPLPTQTLGVPDVIWFVYDQITRNGARPKKSSEPLEFVDSYFHFNAPESNLGIDKEHLTCWSKHSAKKQHINLYKQDDINLTGAAKRVTMQSCLEELRLSPSNGNLQITAIVPNKKGTCTSLRQEEGSTVEYRGEVSGRAKRPCINFQYRGQLPFRSLFVLIPFNGMRQSAFAQVSGSFTGSHEVSVDIVHKNNHYTFYGKNLLSKNPTIHLQ